MLGVLNIVNKYFWKSWSGPFFAFMVAPVITILSMSLFVPPVIIIANALSIPVICIGVTIFPQTIFEFQKSVILKRIAVANVKQTIFVSAIFIYFTSFMIIAVILNLSITSLYVYILYGNSYDFNKVSFSSTYGLVDWWSWIFSQILTIILSLSIGFMNANIFKNVLAIQTSGVLIIIASMFVGGALVPFSMVINIPILNYLSYILPFRYTSALGVESWFAHVDHFFSNQSISLKSISIDSQTTNAFSELIKWLSSSSASNYVFGDYDKESGVFNSLNTDELTKFLTERSEYSKIRITFIDWNKGLLFQTNLKKIIDESLNKEYIEIKATQSLFNFRKSNIWNIHSPFMQLESSMNISVDKTIPNIKTLWVNWQKILSFSLPFVFTGLSLFISTGKFRWNLRG